jgi:hypothetical protein
MPSPPLRSLRMPGCLQLVSHAPLLSKDCHASVYPHKTKLAGPLQSAVRKSKMGGSHKFSYSINGPPERDGPAPVDCSI